MPPPTLKDSCVRKGTVYHYTSSAGMLGILEETPTLRLTNVKYLNDSRELIEGVDIAKEALDKLRRELEPVQFKGLLNRSIVDEESQYIGDAFEEINHWLNNISLLSFFYTASFCEDGDNLRQWMSYCSGGGYAIGFDRSFLKQAVIDERTVFYEGVDYDGNCLSKGSWLESIRQSSVNYSKKITYLLSENRFDTSPLNKEYSRFIEHFKELALSIAHKALRHKQDYFIDERESRLIFSAANQADKSANMIMRGVKFYSKGNLLIPFVEASFPKEAVTKVIIGPMPNQELAHHSLNLLKRRYGYSFDVLTSGMSLRPLS